MSSSDQTITTRSQRPGSGAACLAVPRRRVVITALAAGLSMPSIVRAAAPKAQELLDSVDEVRCPGQPFKVGLTITEFEAGKQVDQSALDVWSRQLEAGAQFSTIVRFMQPAKDKGKLMLRSGNDMWFYDPATNASIRIAPQQRLLGQAANGDVVTIMLARDYTPNYKGEEEITDGERKTRKSHALALVAKSPAATYNKVDMWVDVEQQIPLRARFYAESGHLLKTVFYRRYQQQLGRSRPTETVIIDGLNPQSVTLMRFGNFSSPTIPTTWFNRDYLPRFQPD
jgi:Outer membrane lipoprotein-sorting protein